jgi:hypothetical protein
MIIRLMKRCGLVIVGLSQRGSDRSTLPWTRRFSPLRSDALERGGRPRAGGGG